MSGFPTKDGAICGDCRGPVNAFGCAQSCEGSEAHRIKMPIHAGDDAHRLAVIRGIAEGILRGRRPEFIDREWVTVYELAGGSR